ncbi:hypothetical protein RN001_004098 [Aquatica leii]|uniref:DUF4371 domain-containing protein n=1 Tax=Aquatica leii TaxID=1421715 RepID=A0AAN7QA46_9COLE|nr:hypothetical protein RN001_004098 [Aquatica leii]
MSIFVRFLYIEFQIFREELLAILPLKGNTRGEDLFKVIDEFITKSNISYDKLVSLLTDGAPEMIGKEKGVVKRIRIKNAGLISYQCIIYQAALYGTLSAALKGLMDSLVKLINFMKSHSALQHRHFKLCLSECDSAYSDLLQHNNVRWLSKGQVIEHSWLIKKQVTSFLQNLDTQRARKHFKFVTNKRNMLVLAFLKNILKYLNALNTELQGNGKLICDLRQSVNEFATRFQNFAEMGKLSPFLKSPFEIDVAAEWTDVPAKLFNLSKPSLNMEIISIQHVSLQIYKTVSTEEFWAKHVPEKYEIWPLSLARHMYVKHLSQSIFFFVLQCKWGVKFSGDDDTSLSAFLEEVENFRVARKVSVGQYDIAGIFKSARARVSSVEKAIKEFECTGIFPLNPNIFDETVFIASSENLDGTVEKLNVDVSSASNPELNYKNTKIKSIDNQSKPDKYVTNKKRV